MKRRNFLPLLVLCFLVFPSNFTLADVPCPGEKTFVYNVGEAPAPADAIDYISDGISITPEQDQALSAPGMTETSQLVYIRVNIGPPTSTKITEACKYTPAGGTQTPVTEDQLPDGAKAKLEPCAGSTCERTVTATEGPNARKIVSVTPTFVKVECAMSYTMVVKCTEKGQSYILAPGEGIQSVATRCGAVARDCLGTFPPTTQLRKLSFPYFERCVRERFGRQLEEIMNNQPEATH